MNNKHVARKVVNRISTIVSDYINEKTGSVAELDEQFLDSLDMVVLEQLDYSEAVREFDL